MADRQFWLRVGYGICNNTAPWEDLEGCLKCIYWQMIPKGRVRGSAPAPFAKWTAGSMAWDAHIQEWNVFWPRSQKC
jgi:hypothetical protein